MLSMSVLPLSELLHSLDLVLSCTLFSICIPPKHHFNNDTSYILYTIPRNRHVFYPTPHTLSGHTLSHRWLSHFPAH